MSFKKKKLNKNIILFTGAAFVNSIKSIRRYEKKFGKKFRVGLIYDILNKNIKVNKGVDIVVPCDLSSDKNIEKELKEYKDEVIVLICRGEEYVPFLQKIIPHFPKLNNPTVDSLMWATNKIKMRKKLSAYDKRISPSFMVVNSTKKEIVKKIKNKVGFPLVVKPAGLAASLLVSICFYTDELEKVLKKTFSKIEKIYKDLNGRGKPEILVEGFMEGEIYSVDVYINKNKKIYFCPFVHTKNGRSVGFDDFFEYKMITPTDLNEKSINAAKKVAEKAIKALNLFNSTAHIELMKTENGWKIIELGPRIGGWRNDMYLYSYGINHVMNDILNKMLKKPVIPKKVLAHTAVMQFHTKSEGVLKKILGIKKMKEIKSFKAIKMNKNIGDKCLFAKNGGKPVFNVTLSSKDRSSLFGDIRRTEQLISFEIE